MMLSILSDDLLLSLSVINLTLLVRLGIISVQFAAVTSVHRVYYFVIRCGLTADYSLCLG